MYDNYLAIYRCHLILKLIHEMRLMWLGEHYNFLFTQIIFYFACDFCLHSCKMRVEI